MSNGYALLRRASPDPVIAEVVEIGQMAVARAKNLVLDLRSAEPSQRRPTQWVDIADTIDEVSKLLLHGLNASLVGVVDIPAATWPIQVEKEGFARALLNLAVNARDAMPDGGSLSIKARNVPPGDRTPTELAQRACVAISVEDNGHGMPPERVARAMEPFFTTKPIGSGTGLGLSAVRLFVRESAGAIEIHSEVGQGTVVTMFLPAARQATGCGD